MIENLVRQDGLWPSAYHMKLEYLIKNSMLKRVLPVVICIVCTFGIFMTFVKYLPLDMNTFYNNNDDRMPDAHEAYIAKIITSVKLSKKERNNLLKALDQDLMSEDDIRQAVQNLRSMILP